MATNSFRDLQPFCVVKKTKYGHLEHSEPFARIPAFNAIEHAPDAVCSQKRHTAGTGSGKRERAVLVASDDI